MILVSARLARRQPRRRVDLTWGCGGVRVSPRMQYTATSYAEPLSRVFDDALRPERDVVVTHSGESRYLVERVQFQQSVTTSSRPRPTARSSGGGPRGSARAPPAERQHPPLPRLLLRRAAGRARGGDPVNTGVAILVTVQVTAMVVLTPLLVGLMRQVRARLEGRVGAGVLQPWRDLRKLFAQGVAAGRGHQLGQVRRPRGPGRVEPAGVRLDPAGRAPSRSRWFPTTSSSWCRCCWSAPSRWHWSAWTPASAFGGMGSSRHMTIAALVEPTVLVSVYALSIPVGSSSLSQIVDARLIDPASVAAPVSLLALVALTIAVVAETGRMPVDNPSTHLELDDDPRGDGAGELRSRPRRGWSSARGCGWARCSASSAPCSCRGGWQARSTPLSLLVGVRHADRQARGARRQPSPPSRSSSPSCGCSGSPSCWPAPSCSPSSP